MNKKLKFKKSPSLWEGFRMGLIIFLSIAICTTINAQTPQSNFINYQGVASDAAGAVMADQSITVGIVLRYATTGAAAYAENHSITTDTNGVFSLKIGNGTATTGTYDNFHWGDNMGIAAFVTVAINGTEIGTTELLAVPYAITSGDNRWTQDGDDIENLNTGIVKVNSNLEIGANIQLQLGPAANEISTDGTLNGNSDKAIPTEKAVKTYVDDNGASGLEKITEENKIGWRLKGFDSANYGPIGRRAVDLSYSSDPSNENGATGSRSIAMGSFNTASGWNSTAMGSGTTASGFASTSTGRQTKASGDNSLAIGSVTIASGESSVAMGVLTIASGDRSTAMGTYTKAESYASLAIGRNNEGGFVSGGDTGWRLEDPLFEIGNGSSTSNRNNAFTVLKNGNVGIGRHQPTSLLEVAHKSGTPTSANRTNAFSIRNLGTGRSWQFYTQHNGYLLLFNDGNYKGSFNPTSGAYAVASDRRVKRDIIELNDGTLAKVLHLRPVSYFMKDQKNTKRNLGLISQEVQEIFPSLTHYVKESNLLTLSYTELIPILIKAIQEQQTIIDGQNTKINGLSAEVGQIKTMLKKLSLTNSTALKE